MQNSVQRARSFTELLDLGEDGPYVFSQMFSTEGWRARSRSKRTFKLLKRIDGPLREMLRDGERVFFVTRGVAQPSVLEWYFLGAALYYMNQRAIVLTNQRILLLQIDWRMRAKEMRNQIAYPAMARVKNTLLGNVKVEFHSGTSVLLTGVPRRDRKWLAGAFDRLLGGLEAAPASTELEHLCPHCFSSVNGQPPACTECGRSLKSAKTAAVLSLIYPGAGDLYLGHNVFAFMELLGATVMWVVIVALALDPAVGVLESVILLVFIVVVMHGMDALTTYRIGKKGLLPATGRPGWMRYAAASIVPLLGVGAIALSVPTKARLQPEPVVVAGDRLSPHHYAALVEAGYLEAGETVHYYYSAGASSVLQDGNLFTDDRIVSYEDNYDAASHASARFDEVVDMQVELGLPGQPLSNVYVLRDDGLGFYLIVSTEAGGDREFIEAMTERWRQVRASVSGGWFEGGSGASADEAVIVHGAPDPVVADSLQRWWLGAWLGEEGTDWKLLERLSSTESSLDQLTIEGSDGQRRDFFFRLKSGS